MSNFKDFSSRFKLEVAGESHLSFNCYASELFLRPKLEVQIFIFLAKAGPETKSMYGSFQSVVVSIYLTAFEFCHHA